MTSNRRTEGRKGGRREKERKKEKGRLLALGLLVANDGVEEGREREYGRQTREEVVETRGKFGTSADVSVVALCVVTMGSFFHSLSHETLDFHRKTRKFARGEGKINV